MSTLQEMLGEAPEANEVDVPADEPQAEVADAPEADAQPQEDPAEQSAPEAPEKAPEAPMVPLAALQEERKERQRLLDLLEQQSKPEAKEPESQEAPDFIADGEQAWQSVQTVAQQAARAAQLDVFEENAREKHGNEKIDAALEAFKGATEAEKSAIFGAKNPYRDLVKWHDASALRAEIGEDPAAYKARLREELKAELAAEAAAGVKKGLSAPASLAGNPSIGSRNTAPEWGGPKPLSSIIGE